MHREQEGTQPGQPAQGDRRDCPHHVASRSVIKARVEEEGGMFRAMVFVSPDVHSRALVGLPELHEGYLKPRRSCDYAYRIHL